MDGDEYTCVLKNGYVERKSLEKTDPKVVKFLTARASVDNMPTIGLNEWAGLVPAKNDDPDSF